METHLKTDGPATSTQRVSFLRPRAFKAPLVGKKKTTQKKPHNDKHFRHGAHSGEILYAWWQLSVNTAAFTVCIPLFSRSSRKVKTKRMTDLLFSGAVSIQQS